MRTEPPGRIPPRRFNLGDLVIVVVAAGVFFALARQSWQHGIPSNMRGTRSSVLSSAALGTYTDDPATVYEIVRTGWVVATAALVLLRLRRPRPRWHRLIRQPGFVAALASTMGVVGSIAASWTQNQIGLIRLQRKNPTLYFQDQFRPTIFPQDAASAGCLAIVVAGSLLIASGRWRFERSWLDRGGRLLAVGWLGLLAARVYLDLRL